MYKNKTIKSSDIIKDLGAVVEQNTKHYGDADFKIDKDMLEESSHESSLANPSRFLWISRHSGTWLLSEEKCYLRDSAQFNTWQYYAKQSHSEAITIKSFYVEVTGREGRKIIGRITPISYFDECSRMEKYAVKASRRMVRYSNENGKVSEVYQDAEKYIPSETEEGKYLDQKLLPDDESAYRYALSMARKER